jgi:hypothetical protein
MVAYEYFNPRHVITNYALAASLESAEGKVRALLPNRGTSTAAAAVVVWLDGLRGTDGETDTYMQEAGFEDMPMTRRPPAGWRREVAGPC